MPQACIILDIVALAHQQTETMTLRDDDIHATPEMDETHTLATGCRLTQGVIMRDTPHQKTGNLIDGEISKFIVDDVNTFFILVALI